MFKVFGEGVKQALKFFSKVSKNPAKTMENLAKAAQKISKIAK